MRSVSVAEEKFDKDFSTWQTLGFTFHDSESWRVKGVAQSRLYNNSSFLGVWLISPAVEYKLHPNLDIGGAYLLEDVRADGGDDYTRLHIFWLYLSGHWNLDEHYTFSTRQLLALREIESADHQWVSRHLFSLTYKVTDLGSFSSIGTDTEVFYNYTTDRLFENRFKALKATFTINEQTKCQLYFMLQSKRFGYEKNWETAYVFGQSLSYKF
jgi:hypothetical protein